MCKTIRGVPSQGQIRAAKAAQQSQSSSAEVEKLKAESCRVLSGVVY